MKEFKILHSTKLGIGFELIKAKDVSSLIDKLPKRIITISSIYTDDEDDCLTDELIQKLEIRREEILK